jgi:rhodanese-related sulfurtransferase
MSKTITPQKLAETGAAIQRIDVRSVTEFRAGHIPQAVNIPMDEIESRVKDLDGHRPIVLVCQAGQRARMSAGLLAPCRDDVVVLEGGTNAWKQADLPIVVSNRVRWSLERQVRLGAGLIVIVSVVLGAFVNPGWLGLTAFVGLGLCFAGLTDICPMGILLSRMPWNVASRCPTPGTGPNKAQCC